MTKCNFCNKEVKDIDIQYKKVHDEKIPCCRLCCAKYGNKELEQAKIRNLIKKQMSKIVDKDLLNTLEDSAYN